MKAAFFVALYTAGCATQVQLGGPLIASDLDPPRVRFHHGDAGICAIREPGDVLCWKGLVDGQHMRTMARDAVEVGVGDQQACALHRRDQPANRAHQERVGPVRGGVTCWTYDDEAKLHVDPVAGLVDPVRIAVSPDDAACAIERSGQVMCWGTNNVLVDVPQTQLDHATPVPGLDDAVHLARGSGVGCVVHNSGEVSCWGRARGSPRPERIEGVHDAVQVATSGMFGCARLAGGKVVCWHHPHPTQGYGTTDDALPPILVPDVDDAMDLSVSWGTVCVRRRSGALICAGKEHDEVHEPREIAGFRGAEAVTSDASSPIFCGVDGDGTILTTDNAVGFCGEYNLFIDGAGVDLVDARLPSYTADLSARLRFGGGARITPEAEALFFAALHVPMLFGTAVETQIGPFVELGFMGFRTFEPSAGVELLLPIADHKLWVSAGFGYAAREQGSEPIVSGSLGWGVHEVIGDYACAERCGMRYSVSGGLELFFRRGVAGSFGATEVGLAVTFDPALIVRPFMLL